MGQTPEREAAVTGIAGATKGLTQARVLRHYAVSACSRCGEEWRSTPRRRLLKLRRFRAIRRRAPCRRHDRRPFSHRPPSRRWPSTAHCCAPHPRCNRPLGTQGRPRLRNHLAGEHLPSAFDVVDLHSHDDYVHGSLLPRSSWNVDSYVLRLASVRALRQGHRGRRPRATRGRGDARPSRACERADAPPARSRPPLPAAPERRRSHRNTAAAGRALVRRAPSSDAMP